MQKHPVTIIRASGDLDMRECRMIGTVIDTLIAQEQKQIVIECSGADWIDPMGIGIFLAKSFLLTHQGGELKFAATNPMIKGIFWKYGIDRLLENYDRIDDAIVSFHEEWVGNGTSH